MGPVAIALLLAAAPTAPAAVHEPAEAIAMADHASTMGKSGRFAMTVVSTGKSARATFLNSTADYKRADDLTFAIKPIVADELAKRYGARPETYFKGKRVVVDGIVKRNLIVNNLYGQPRSANRYQHEVEIDHPSQIVAVN